MSSNIYTRGFSLTEVLVMLVIIGIIFTLTISSFSRSKPSSLLKEITQTLVFQLEEIKADALSGLKGESQGIHIDTNSYTVFEGDVYDPNAGTNSTYTIDSDFELSSTHPTLIFDRITGKVGMPITITIIFKNDPTLKKDIVIGSRGDISVIE